jgi:GTP-binding protein YchF
MRIAIVGFPYSGKTSLFLAVSAVPRDHLKPAEENLATVKVPEPRLEWLDRVFQPKRCIEAAIDFVDLPGSTEGDVKHAGLSKHLPTLRQSDALVVVVRGFKSDAVLAHEGRVDPRRDLTQLRDETLLADLEGCDNRVQKLQAAVAKPTQEHDEQKQELDVLLRCREALENERPLREVVQPGDEEKLLRSFGFLTQKPVILVINVGEQEIGREPPFRDEQAAATFALCAELEAELIQMDRADRPEFMAEWGIPALARDRIIRACFDALGMITFFTFVHDEVRAWAIPKGTTAVEAAGKIHTDIARGFIRAETVAFDALKAAGSLKEAKSAGHIRQEHKNYVVQDGDVITVKFHV